MSEPFLVPESTNNASNVTKALTSATDNIGGSPAGPAPVDKEARKARRLDLNKQRSTEWRAERRRLKPATRAAVMETVALCLLDLITIPPERQPARKRVAGEVLSQAVRTLEAMGHPDVDGSVTEALAHLRTRLTTETWHHRWNHASQPTPVDTPVTPSIRHPHRAAGIAVSTGNTEPE